MGFNSGFKGLNLISEFITDYTGPCQRRWN